MKLSFYFSSCMAIGIYSVMFFGGCVGRNAARDADGAGPSRPNIILISIDSLRADHLGSYGYDRPTSPAIDALGAEGVLFERAQASIVPMPASHCFTTGC